MILLTRLIGFIVVFVGALGGRSGRAAQGAAWTFIVVTLGAGIGLVAVGVSYIDDLVDVLEPSRTAAEFGEAAR